MICQKNRVICIFPVQIIIPLGKMKPLNGKVISPPLHIMGNLFLWYAPSFLSREFVFNDRFFLSYRRKKAYAIGFYSPIIGFLFRWVIFCLLLVVFYLHTLSFYRIPQDFAEPWRNLNWHCGIYSSQSFFLFVFYWFYLSLCGFFGSYRKTAAHH